MPGLTHNLHPCHIHLKWQLTHPHSTLTLLKLCTCVGIVTCTAREPRACQFSHASSVASSCAGNCCARNVCPAGLSGLVDHGVHAIVVPLRDEAGRCLPGVEIHDCGYKVRGSDTFTVCISLSVYTFQLAASEWHKAGTQIMYVRCLRTRSCAVYMRPSRECALLLSAAAGGPQRRGQRGHTLQSRACAPHQPAGPLCER